jgi:hypothetical protein
MPYPRYELVDGVYGFFMDGKFTPHLKKCRCEEPKNTQSCWEETVGIAGGRHRGDTGRVNGCRRKKTAKDVLPVLIEAPIYDEIFETFTPFELGHDDLISIS